MTIASKPHPQIPLTGTVRNLRWLLRVLINPKLYDIIDSTILQDASKLDSTLSTICYFSLFLSQLIKLKPYLARWMPRLYKSKWLNLSLSEVTVSEKLQMISSYLSDIRIFNRMWAAVPLMSWLLSTYSKILTKNYSRFDKLIDFIEVTSCLVLQIFENVGFVGDHHFTTQSDKLSLWFNIWCCKLWALYVVTDLVKVLTRDKLERNALVSNLANLPLTVHWSIPEGCLTPLQVGICGTFSSCLDTLDYWRDVIQQVKKL